MSYEKQLSNLIEVAKLVKSTPRGALLSVEQLLEGDGRRLIIDTYRGFEGILAEIQRDERLDDYKSALQAARPDITAAELDESVALQRIVA